VTEERLAEIEQRVKTAYYWKVLAVPSLVVDEDMEWLIEEVKRLRKVLREYRAKHRCGHVAPCWSNDEAFAAALGEKLA
jgi:hypothetical protein